MARPTPRPCAIPEWKGRDSRHARTVHVSSKTRPCRPPPSVKKPTPALRWRPRKRIRCSSWRRCTLRRRRGPARGRDAGRFLRNLAGAAISASRTAFDMAAYVERALPGRFSNSACRTLAPRRIAQTASMAARRIKAPRIARDFLHDIRRWGMQCRLACPPTIKP